MNIFFTDEDPIKAAQSLCDKHVVKMVLESAQILCSVINVINNEQIAPYRTTHKNHPCVKWAMLSPQNFDWLHRHAMALCKEYTFRYDKRHKSQNVIEWCGNNRVTKLLSDFTSPAQAMPDEYKHSNPVIAYRQYYIQDKMKNIDCRWTKRKQPKWTK